MSSNVDKIKERLSIVDVVSSYIKVEKAGSNFKAKCPFHNEKTPSFFISPTRESYYCFGCNAKGDIFNFVQDFEGLDFFGALKTLALRAGVDIKVEAGKEKSENERIFELLDIATVFFEGNLEKKPDAKNYLKKRGLTEDTIKSWRIGYAEDQWRSILNFCRDKGFSELELQKAGLVKKSQEKGDYYDVFRSRIIFPIFDSASRPVAFSGRLLEDREDAPKYLNSPETVLFNKSEILYGFDRAKLAIRRKNYSVLVEGQMDLLMSHQAGFENTVASSGTALSPEQLIRLNRLSSRIILAYDGDSAGFRAAERSARLALSLGMNVKVASLPKKEDPASLISKDHQKWMETLKNSTHIIEFYLDKIISSDLPQRRIDQEIKTKVLPLVKILPSQIDQARFISEIADKANIKESAVWDDFKKIPNEGEVSESVVKIKDKLTESRRSNIISKLASIIFWQETLAESDLNRAKILEKTEKLLGDKEFFEKNLGSRKNELIFEAESYFSGREDLSNIIDDLFLNFEEEVLKDEFARSMQELSLAEKSKDKEKADLLLKKCKDLGGKINTLKVNRADKQF